MISNSRLHYVIIKEVVDNGYAPDLKSLSEVFNVNEQEIERALYELQEYHGVVLHPNQPKIWAIHPFSLAPTNFYVKSNNREWWGCCAWCSFGIAVLINEDVTITTTIGAKQQQIVLHINDGELQEKGFYVHFPIHMKNVWDNVIYTCSNLLVFNNEEEINHWTKRHNIPKGDFQSIEKIWNLSKDWYKYHLRPDWQKWRIKEARNIFSKHELNHAIWKLEGSGDRF